MKQSKEVWGFRLEIAGLVLLLLGGIWQANFSAWWDNTGNEWQHWIQEEVNFALLYSMDDISVMLTTDDASLKQSLATKVSDRVGEAVSFAIAERDKRKAVLQEGQAALFAGIEKWLIMLGALLVIIGKYYCLQGVKERN